MKKFVLFFSISFLYQLHAFSQYNKSVSVEPLLKTDTNYIGQKIIYPDGDSTESTILKITFPPGATTGWHIHDYPLFGYILQGELTVEVEGREPEVLKAGTAATEVIGIRHCGTNRGKTDLVMIVFYLGKKGKPLVR